MSLSLIRDARETRVVNPFHGGHEPNPLSRKICGPWAHSMKLRNVSHEKHPAKAQSMCLDIFGLFWDLNELGPRPILYLIKYREKLYFTTLNYVSNYTLQSKLFERTLYTLNYHTYHTLHFSVTFTVMFNGILL